MFNEPANQDTLQFLRKLLQTLPNPRLNTDPLFSISPERALFEYPVITPMLNVQNVKNLPKDASTLPAKLLVDIILNMLPLILHGVKINIDYTTISKLHVSPVRTLLMRQTTPDNALEYPYYTGPFEKLMHIIIMPYSTNLSLAPQLNDNDYPALARRTGLKINELPRMSELEQAVFQGTSKTNRIHLKSNIKLINEVRQGDGIFDDAPESNTNLIIIVLNKTNFNIETIHKILNALNVCFYKEENIEYLEKFRDLYTKKSKLSQNTRLISILTTLIAELEKTPKTHKIRKQIRGIHDILINSQERILADKLRLITNLEQDLQRAYEQLKMAQINALFNKDTLNEKALMEILTQNPGINLVVDSSQHLINVRITSALENYEDRDFLRVLNNPNSPIHYNQLGNLSNLLYEIFYKRELKLYTAVECTYRVTDISDTFTSIDLYNSSREYPDALTTMPHPHLSTHLHCFGQYRGPIIKSLNAGDLVSALLYMKASAQNINWFDGAVTNIFKDLMKKYCQRNYAKPILDTANDQQYTISEALERSLLNDYADQQHHFPD